MNRDVHEEINATLRRAMADLVNGDRGTWGILGCYIEQARIGWKSLDGLGKAMIGRLQDRFEHDGIQLGAIFEAATAVAAELPGDACGIDLEGLRGVAILGSIEHPERGAICLVDAFFDDGWRHLTTWGLDEAAPVWNLISPADQVSAEAVPRPAWDLLAALRERREARAAAHWTGRWGREDHEHLSVMLRIAAADHVDKELIAILLVVKTDADWEVKVDRALSRMVDSLVVGESLSIREAIERIALGFGGRPVPEAMSRPVGMAVLVNHTGDGEGMLGLTALCDGIVHAVSWSHTDAFPDWEITPISQARPEAGPVLPAYQRLLDALNSID